MSWLWLEPQGGSSCCLSSEDSQDKRRYIMPSGDQCILHLRQFMKYHWVQETQCPWGWGPAFLTTENIKVCFSFEKELEAPYPPLEEPLGESERGEWKSWLKAQHSENEDHGIWSHYFMGNRWGNSGNSGWLYFWGSKITADGDCSHEIKRRLLLGRKVVTNLDSIL